MAKIIKMGPMEGVRSKSWGAETKGSTPVEWEKLLIIFVFPLKSVSIFF